MRWVSGWWEKQRRKLVLYGMGTAAEECVAGEKRAVVAAATQPKHYGTDSVARCVQHLQLQPADGHHLPVGNVVGGLPDAIVLSTIDMGDGRAQPPQLLIPFGREGAGESQVRASVC
jgi:hypothetical protein